MHEQVGLEQAVVEHRLDLFEPVEQELSKAEFAGSVSQELRGVPSSPELVYRELTVSD